MNNTHNRANISSIVYKASALSQDNAKCQWLSVVGCSCVRYNHTGGSQRFQKAKMEISSAQRHSQITSLPGTGSSGGAPEPGSDVIC